MRRANGVWVLGLEVEGRDTHIQAYYPYRELRTFASRLEGITFGRGRFTYTISHYDRLPANQIADVVRSSPFRRESDSHLQPSARSK